MLAAKFVLDLSGNDLVNCLEDFNRNLKTNPIGMIQINNQK